MGEHDVRWLVLAALIIALVYGLFTSSTKVFNSRANCIHKRNLRCATGGESFVI
jgi:hypothetical protein